MMSFLQGRSAGTAVLAFAIANAAGAPPATMPPTAKRHTARGGTHAFLRDLPQRILHQPCRLTLDGDSICTDGLNSRMFCGLIKTLTPDRTTGVGNTAQMIGGGTGPVAGYTDTYPTGTFGAGVRGFGHPIGGVGGIPSSGSAAEAAIWPCQYADSGIWPANSPPSTTWWQGALPALNRAQFAGGDWFTGPGTIHLFLYRGIVGVPSGINTLVERPWGGPAILTAPNDLGGTYLDYTLSANPPQCWEPYSVAWTIQAREAAPPQEPDETGHNLYLLGTRYVKDETGLELSSTSVGSSSTADHINPARRTQSAVDNYVRLYNVNTVLIWLGENDGAIDSDWYDGTLANIAMWRAAILANGGEPRFLLITTYETLFSTTPARCQAMAAYQLQIAQDYADVGWYGLGLEAGSFSQLDAAHYLNDGVHPSVSGAVYFGGLINAALLAGLPQACYANCDASTEPPVLNVIDFTCFLNRYAAGQGSANCDNSTTPPTLNVLDFACFLNQFAIGCP